MQLDIIGCDQSKKISWKKLLAAERPRKRKRISAEEKNQISLDNKEVLQYYDLY